ncbi:hypothetical protein IFM46972_11546 [Aspergillus udagawae]|uniref:Uncharacterized protein n=1 Tax=Aspergillus udagawae TaxID=91492 RepID=A0A8H3XSK8_9EURO|nr:hypothetical protein IFM46972_11546 [Aspergillus udagawae]
MTMIDRERETKIMSNWLKPVQEFWYKIAHDYSSAGSENPFRTFKRHRFQIKHPGLGSGMNHSILTTDLPHLVELLAGRVHGLPVAADNICGHRKMGKNRLRHGMVHRDNH